MGEVPSTEGRRDLASVDAVESFIRRWQGNEGGAERANYALFLTELCDLLGLPHPDPADASHAANDYVFERAVTFREAGNRVGHGRIDLYRRGAFVLEAKQSRARPEKAIPGQNDLFDPTASPEARGRRGAARAWDILMLNARRQAETYARALPADHDWPPFILVCDVGHCIEVYSDFTGRGRNYTQFPDRQGFRVYLEDLRRPEIRERLRLIWSRPHALDPTKKAAEATRKIAGRLAEVSKSLEARGFEAEQVAMFLMRCLFTMFAEDVKLLPEGSFTSLLERCIEKPANFTRMVGQLWEKMNTGGFAYGIEADVRKFNGRLFESAIALPLERQEIGELHAAASANWREVEPAIFGTLLEQALDARERKRLGAHYTPRAYVERLVVATIVEPLRRDWEDVLSTVERRKEAGDAQGAAALVAGFHDRLCETRVLDPACGTGNFLYVSLELIKRLEGEVLEALADLGGQEALAGLERHTVDPHQFLGLEINPRAAAIAELVLWIGYLQWHFRTRGEAPSEPILRAFGNVKVMDAVLTWDGWPMPKIVEGRETYPNARKPEWPEAEFIVGNPPFIGGKDIRSRLGDGYAETLWKAHPGVNTSADFVMYWWDRAADILARKGSALRRFGLVTTNSITQVFNRRVVARRLSGKPPVSLIMAIPDHPWTKATKDAAAVRIAMTVAVRGERPGVLREVVSETGLDTDEPEIEFEDAEGRINADLTVGVDVTAAEPLLANAGLCCNGMKPLGSGFIVTETETRALGVGRRAGLENHIWPYRNGRDLTSRARNVFAIDLWGLTEREVRERFPEVYQHLASTVKMERDRAAEQSKTRDAKEYADRWWTFCKPRQEIRSFTAGLERYVVTVQTAKYRLFQLLDRHLMPDQKLMVIGTNDPFLLGVLSSSVHTVWTLRTCSWLGVGNDSVYVKVRTFDPFPFPDPPEDVRAEIRALAEELDATRKAVQAEHPDLTLTGLYNVLEKLKSGEPLTGKDEDIKTRGRVLILKELHDRIDAATFRAYGWPADLSDEDILARLVALNRERAAEEAAGRVRWLRPDYQIARFGTSRDRAEQIEAVLEAKAGKAAKPVFPKNEVEQTAAVFAALLDATAPVSAGDIAATFRQGRKIEKSVAAILRALARVGHATAGEGGTYVLKLDRAA